MCWDEDDGFTNRDVKKTGWVVAASWDWTCRSQAAWKGETDGCGGREAPGGGGLWG